MQRKTNYFAVGLIVASFLLSLSLGVDSASAASATITTNTDITLNASSAGNGVSIDEESIGITTTCNKGYNLTIATSTSTDLYLNGDSTKTAAYTAVDGTSALDSTNNTNKWGYTLTNDATASTVFSPLSTTASSIRTISQTTNVTSETIPIYYGIKTDSTIDPGTYAMGNNGTITYYLTMNPLCNVVDIAYDGNNADAGTMGAAGTGVIHTGVRDGDTVDLIASNFSRDGYGFAGWSLDQDAGTKLLDNDNTNNPIVYGPQESITLPEGFTANDTDNDGIVKFYAVWLQSQGNLQGWMGCDNLDTATYDSTTGKLDLTKNSVTALTDQRDNDTYAVARLADGKCWMIENLRLNNSASLTLANTNNPLNNGTNVTIKHNYTDATTSNTLSPTSNVAYDVDTAPDGWCTTNSAACDDQSRIRTDNTTNRATDNPSTNSGSMYSYGNYYNWYSATAGRGTYSFSTNNNSVAGDLCPAGWHLPIGGRKANVDVSDFWKLSRATIGADPANFADDYFYYMDAPEGAEASSKMRSYPVNYLYSGYASGGSLFSRGDSGYFWSSTAYSAGNAYGLYLHSFRVYPGTYNGNKYFGRAMRCVASDPQTYTLSYDANGGTGAPEAQTETANGLATFTVSDVVPTHSKCSFAGWEDVNANIVQPGGTYTANETNTTLRATWTCPYEIAYDINTTDTNAEGTMGNQTKDDSGADLAENAEVTLLASNFSRTGYGFAGWSLDADAATNASAKIYGPQETIAAPSASIYGNNGVVTLYAVWVPSAGSIQDTTVVSNVCNGLTVAPTDGTANISSVSALTDQRDNETYAIARLADGNCWMIENLRLEAEDTRTPEKQALAQGYGASTTYGDFTGLADAESANFTNTNPPVANSLYSTDGSTTNIIKGGNSSDYYTRMPRYNHGNTNSRESNPAPTSNTVAMYSYGNYYTWAAAIASVKQYNSATSTDDEGKTSETANTSLCPTGWRLPYGRDFGNGKGVGGFYNLNYKINNDVNVTDSTASLKIRSFPNNFLYSGYFGASTYGRGSYGVYWSSTAATYNYSYRLYLDSSSVHPADSDVNSKYSGLSIRCTVSAGN